MPRLSDRQLPIALFALGILAAAAGILLLRGCLGSGPGDAAQTFLEDWSSGADRRAADHTDRPRVAAAALRANRAGLDGARLDAELGEVSERGDTAAVARVQLRWRIPGIGPWSYSTRLPLLKQDGDWHVGWTPALVHPRLDADTRLGTTREFAERAPILGRGGRAIVRERPVVRVGAVVSEVSDPGATATGLASVLDVDRRPILRQLRGGGPQQFVEALVLRRAEYAALEPALATVPDVTAIEGSAPLAPTREFARALIGTVAPVTAEQLERLGDDYAPGDQVGQWGLQRRFERRLAGTPTERVVIRASAGTPIATLLERKGRRGRALETTLDTGVQLAAEAALGQGGDEAALVALAPSSGDILAVANRPVDSSFNRGLEGRYPPGSTFKVVTTAALLRAGLAVDETVDCPATLSVGGKLFRNFEGGAAGAVPFSQDFAQSCNTAFVSLADRLEPDALTRVGRDFGLGPRLELPLAAPAASVPPGRSDVERAAAMIGQHEILASPLSMAGVAATVAAGRWRPPRLLTGELGASARPLAADERDTLRALMRSVVTSGTGTALAVLPGEPAGKSGTAEFGSGDPPPTHAWFIAYREDVAVAVLVENGESGGAVAAPLAAAFFGALDAP
jgi:cell division protein FtsI/penicillin-binding protein 2